MASSESVLFSIVCRVQPLRSGRGLSNVLNAAARLIARLPRFSHISTFMAEQLHWLPLSVRNSKFSFSCSNLNWVLLQNIFVTKFSTPSLPRQSVLSDPLTGLTFLFPVLGQQWLNPGPLCA